MFQDITDLNNPVTQDRPENEPEELELGEIGDTQNLTPDTIDNKR
jgi:hypothetical protein